MHLEAPRGWESGCGRSDWNVACMPELLFVVRVILTTGIVVVAYLLLF